MDLKEIDASINHLLHLNAIRKCQPGNGQFISNIFLVPKSDGSNRVILNLKSLNEFVIYQHFKLEDFKIVRRIVTKNTFMATLDLKDAYLMLPIKSSHRKYLRFRFNSIMYEYTCLPFGLSSAPFVYTKLMKPILAHLRARGFSSVLYLDDFLLLGDTFEECLKNVQET